MVCFMQNNGRSRSPLAVQLKRRVEALIVGHCGLALQHAAGQRCVCSLKSGRIAVSLALPVTAHAAGTPARFDASACEGEAGDVGVSKRASVPADHNGLAFALLLSVGCSRVPFHMLDPSLSPPSPGRSVGCFTSQWSVRLSARPVALTRPSAMKGYRGPLASAGRRKSCRVVRYKTALPAPSSSLASSEVSPHSAELYSTPRRFCF